MYERLKKDTKWSILELGKFDVSAIKEEVLLFEDEWLLDISRQYKGFVHRDTKMFRICETDYDWISGTPIETFQRNNLKNNRSQIELLDIFNTLEQHYSGKVIRCEIISMAAKTKVQTHIDGGALLHYSRRVHIPLITTKDVMFTVMDKSIHMEQGGWYEINNQMRHGVDNPSEFDRVHLIIDVLPDDMLHYR